MKTAFPNIFIVLTVLLSIAFAFTIPWDRPPLDAEQVGFRGVGMERVVNPRTAAKARAATEIPEVIEQEAAGGQPVSEIYENVQVLGHLNVEQFDRVMASITEWVAPDEGCAYCHNEDNLASEEKYTKDVSRKMILMTQAINADWEDHVKSTGVTCFTCHAGQPVPPETWFTAEAPKQAGGMTRARTGENMQNLASKNVGTTALPFDPYTPFLLQDRQISVIPQTTLPEGHDKTIKDTEWTYALMFHFSRSLGVNCTHCHNSARFYNWEQSPPARVQAHAGIAMVRELNNEHLVPLTGAFPESRKGPTGDVAKVNCMTCHQGVTKPLYGAEMAKHFPSLQGRK